MILGRDLQHGRRRRRVRVNHVTNHLGVVLVDQDDVDVVALQETLEAVLNLADGGVYPREFEVNDSELNWLVLEKLTLIDDHEVGVTVLVDLADSTEQEAYAGVLISDDGNKLSLDGRQKGHCGDWFFCKIKLNLAKVHQFYLKNQSETHFCS